jgi:hypothetical protein
VVLRAERALFGHDPTVYHFFNLLIHLANVLLVALLVRRGLAYTNLASRYAIGPPSRPRWSGECIRST